MNSKICTAVITLLMMSVTAQATVSAKSAASPRAKAVATKAQEAIEEGRKEYKAKGGKIDAMSHKTKAAFILAIKSYTDKLPGLSSNSLMRLLLAPELTYLEGKDVIAQVEALMKMKASGNKELIEAADVKLELMELAGIRLDQKNMGTKEFEALRVLLSIDLQAVPQAVPVMAKIVKNLRSGSMSVELAVTEGMKGMKGTLEDFINLCGKA